MWTTMVLAMAAVMASGGSAATATAAARADSLHARCVQYAIWQAPIERPLTLVSRDGSRTTGQILGIDASRGTVRIRPKVSTTGGIAPERGSAPRELPATDVLRVEWHERPIPPIAGALAGMVIGGLIGFLASDPDEESKESSIWFNVDAIEDASRALSSAALGGAVGLTIGFLAASSLQEEHAIGCAYGRE